MGDVITGRLLIVAIAALELLQFGGCAHPKLGPATYVVEESAFSNRSLVEMNAVVPEPRNETIASTPEPYHVQSTGELVYWNLTVEDAVQIALQNSQILRDLGGRIITQSNLAATRFNPSVNASDARTGIDAALSEFDSQLSASLLWRRNNRGLKLPPPGVTNIEVDQLIHQGRTALTKRMPNGTRFELQQGLDFERDDFGIPPNRFASAYTPFIGAEVRHPLARGGGRAFNQIAGPNAPPGTYNGVLIAKIRTEIAEDDFSIALRDYIYNVVRSYWLLQFAYERVAAQERSLEITRKLHSIADSKARNGVLDVDAVNAAMERTLTAELAVQEAMAGSPERQLSSILGPNGAFLSGTELGTLSLERRLRFLMGLPASDGRLIRPVDEPSTAPILFDWQEALSLALERRPELKRQDKLIQQRRWELMAARNHLLPTVDLIGQYRLLGFGDDFYGNHFVPQGSAIDELLDGELQEWAAGMEVRWPWANRIGKTAERNALLQLAREEEILRQQQLQVSHEVSSAVSELRRAESALRLNRQRRDLARERSDAASRKFEEGLPIPLEQVLEAQARDAEASVGLALSLADYQVAVAALSVARGTIMQDHCVNFTDEPISEMATTESAPRTASVLLLQPQR